MNCELIFYTAGKTATNQTVVEQNLKTLGININNITVATSIKTFVHGLKNLVSISRLIFIIGGTYNPKDNNTITILSKALSLDTKRSANYPVFKDAVKLDDTNSCLLSRGDQAICVLPDDPNKIEHIFKSRLIGIIKSKYNIDKTYNYTPEDDLLNRVQNEIKEMYKYDSINESYLKELYAPQSEKKKKLVNSKLFVIIFIITGIIILSYMIYKIFSAPHYITPIESYEASVYCGNALIYINSRLLPLYLA